MQETFATKSGKYIEWNIIQLQKKEIVTYATTQMSPEGMTLSEISQSQKDNNCMTPLTGGVSTQNQSWRAEWWLPGAQGDRG